MFPPPLFEGATEGGDPVTGSLGSFTWGDGGSDSPWLPGGEIAVGTGEQLTEVPGGYQCAYATFDPASNAWTKWKLLKTPDLVGRFFQLAPGCVQWLVRDDGDLLRVLSEPGDLATVREALESAEVEVESADIVMEPKNTVEVKGNDAKSLLGLIETPIDWLGTTATAINPSGEAMTWS